MRRLGTLGVVVIPYLLIVAVGVLIHEATNTPIGIQLDPSLRFLAAAAILGLPNIAGFNVFQRLLSPMAPAPRKWWKTLLYSWLWILGSLAVLNVIIVFIADESTWVTVKLFGLPSIFWLAGLVLVYMHFGRVDSVLDSHAR